LFEFAAYFNTVLLPGQERNALVFIYLSWYNKNIESAVRRYRKMSTRKKYALIFDSEDEAFCERMVRDYENDPDKGDPMPIEDFAKQLGIKL